CFITLSIAAWPPFANAFRMPSIVNAFRWRRARSTPPLGFGRGRTRKSQRANQNTSISAPLFRRAPVPALLRLPRLPLRQNERIGQVLCDGPDIPGRVHRGGDERTR